jgi:hypothetical protein
VLLRLTIFLYLLFSLQSCSVRDSGRPNQLFTLLEISESGIDFSNDVDYSEEFNMYTFRNFYNGAGVAIGDVNNDGLADIYFCGNMNGNRLYLNKGNLKFEDITEKAKVGCGKIWSTGVSMIDVNGDGWLDLYVCKSGKPEGGNRNNELFINNHDLTFSERSKEYGLAITGLSTHAVFFDYDKDGDLDCYLLTNSIKSVDNYDLVSNQRKIQDPQGGGNKLLKNEGGKFVDVTQYARIYSSVIGFGLGVSIGDVNKDGWMDIYVSNDFFERDYLYINAGDGTFKEVIEGEFKSLSMGSMGADIADINNDSYPDIFVTEMLPQTNERVKTKVSFDNWNRYQMKIDAGYFYQYPRNVLQLNNGDGTFSEIGRLGELDATDWSWGALIFDADNDGLKDIYVSNGIFKDLLDQDYINFMANPETVRSLYSKENGVLAKMIDIIPSHPISNVAFKNLGDLKFREEKDSWGLNHPGFSNGSAYGDLDNDGDLDLVVNNINMPAFIYRNNTNQLLPDNHFIEFILKGKELNSYAIGTKITLYSSSQVLYCEQNPVRGFMSSVDSKLHVGLGSIKIIDKVKIEWPSGSVTQLDSIIADRAITLSEK